jgi:transposase
MQKMASLPVISIPLSDSEWARVQHLFPVALTGRGRPRRSDRDILDAILWIIQNGEKWHRIPANFPPSQTCYARFTAWKKSGVLTQALALLDIVAQA